MAFGKRTGGRQKGTRNKRTAEREAEIKAAGILPLDFMLQVMRDGEQPIERRLEAARSAAPYIHPRIAQKVEVSGAGGGPIQTEDKTMLEVARDLAFIFNGAVRQKK